MVAKRAQPLEEIRPRLEAILRQRKLEEKLQDLQGKYKVVVDSEFFAPQATAPPRSIETITPPMR